MPIRDLRVTNVGPFNDITFEFDTHINVFVGPNCSGKSTALMALADIAAYPFALPGRLRRKAPAAFIAHFVGRNGQSQELTGSLPVDQKAPDNQAPWANILATLGYSAFVPALRQSTAFRAAGPGLRTPGAEPPQLPEELFLRRSLLPTDASLVRDEAILERMVEFADRAPRKHYP